MVLGEEELERAAGAPLDVEAYEGRPPPVERAAPLVVVARRDRRALRVLVQAAQVLEGDGGRRVRVHQLQGLVEAVQVEGGAQHLVAAGQGGDGRAPGPLVEGGADVVARDVVVDGPVGGQVAVEEHAGLQAGHRIGVVQAVGQRGPVPLGQQREGHVVRLGLFVGASGDDGREPADGLVPHQVEDGEVQAPLAGAGQQLDAADRVAAEGEVVVERAHPLPAEDLLPDLGEGGLHGPARRLVGRAGVGRGVGRVGQPAAVHLAVGGQRERGEPDERGGDHVGGQAPGEVLAQRVHGRLAVRGVRRDRQIAHEGGGARGVGPDERHRRVGQRMGGEGGLDLAQLDPEAPDLHLVVDPPQVLQLAVGQDPRQVAGAVEPFARPAERVGGKPLGGQPRAAQIASRQAGPAHEQLARDTHGYGPAAPVQQVQPEIGDRHADDAAPTLPRVARGQRAVRDVHGGLRDAVHVDQPGRGVRVPVEPGRERPHVQGLAAEDDEPQRQLVPLLRRAVRVGPRQLVEGGGRLVEHGDPLGAQQAVELLGRPTGLVGHHHQAPAVRQRAPQLPDGEVEGDRVEEGPDVVGPEAEPVVGGGEQPGDVAVRDQGALRAAGGARGVDGVRQVVGGDSADGRGGRLGGQGVREQVDRAQRQPAPQVRGVRGADEVGQPGVADDVAQPLGRVVGVERQVGAARLEDAEQADDQLRRAPHAQPDERVGTDAESAQPVRHLVGAAVQLAVGEAGAPVDEGDGIGVGGGVPVEQLVGAQGGVGRLGGRRGGDSLPLVVREHRQRVDGQGGPGHGLVQQAPVVAGDPLDRRRLEEVGAVLQPAPDPAVAGLHDVEGQVELGAAGGAFDVTDGRAGQAPRHAALVVVAEHHVEERGAAVGGPLRGEVLHDPLERQVLVVLRVEDRVPDAAQEVPEGRVA